MIELVEILKYSIPLLILGVIVYFLLDKLLSEESARRKVELQLKDRDMLVPMKLQAYERMALFLERVRPTHLVRRVEISENLDAYEYHIVNTIQEEFDHNLSQQIYVHPETWKIVYAAKNTTQNFIKQCREGLGPNATSQELRAEIIRRSLDGSAATNAALLKLQKDVQGDFEA
ncbi:MAG: hypothetical protein Q4F57_09435 [Weeksellaceae bacterium]|nr:hypothetical protein [Weeksellaceae bacterium]